METKGGCFHIRSEASPKRPFTRRGILSALSSLYDPIGFVSPVVLEGRLLLQTICKRKAQLDDEITTADSEKWIQWTSCLPQIGSLRISRCLKPNAFGQIRLWEIHNFSDASSYAYGACSYLRVINENDESFCSFFF